MSISAIEREFGGETPKILALMVDEDVAVRYGIHVTSVNRWEAEWGVKCLRRCKGCGEVFKHRDMALTKAGRPNFGRCKECIKSIPRDANSGRARADVEYERIADLPMPATPGRLPPYWCQGVSVE